MPASLVAAITTALLVVVAPSQSASAGAAGTLALQVELHWVGSDAACPGGTPSTIGCHPHTGDPAPVPGFGEVT